MNGIEFRVAEGTLLGDRWLSGYAAVFDTKTLIGDYFVEQIARNAFSKSLREDDQLALLDHDSGRVIGRKSAGTLKLNQDSVGLRVEIDLPRTMDGDSALELVRRGDLKGMSFSMRVLVEHWDDSGDLPVRTVEQAELYEVSAVAFPAYPATSIGLRSLDRVRRSNGSSGTYGSIGEREAAMERKFRRLS